MRLIVTTEQRFLHTPDGAFWTTSAFPYSFWLRYLQVFEQLRVVARACEVDQPPPQACRSDGERVEFHPVPYYIGPGQFLRTAPRVYSVLSRAVTHDDAVIMRVASWLAMLMEHRLRRQDHPYGVEVVGDPYNVFAPGSVRHPLRPLLRWLFTHAQKRQCWNAMGVAYVTRYTLQKRYPCRAYQTAISDVELLDPSEGATRRVFQAHYSSIELVTDAYSAAARIAAGANRRLRLILVGSLEQYYKGPDVLIDALGQLVYEGCDLELVIVGDGRLRTALEERARRAGVGERVFFRGMLPAGAAVRAELDAADLFVLPSRTEGLPRAMIEAMARGLPCIGSTAGGIPELLPTDNMVPPGDVHALAARIREVISSPARMQAMSDRNFSEAQEYHADILSQRRNAFYQHIRSVTEAWSRRRA